MVELEMKEWIRSGNKENGTNKTECPYCHIVFKQTVNSKWCPGCDQAVLLTKGMPYQNYIPISPFDRDQLKYRKQILTYIRERTDIFEKDPNFI